jgi:curved DNA-binding protein CbpA
MSYDPNDDFYVRLGLTAPAFATPEKIRQARKVKLKELHPDREGGSEEKAKKINEAAATLLDPVSGPKYQAARTKFFSDMLARTRVAVAAREAKRREELAGDRILGATIDALVSVVRLGFAASAPAPRRKDYPPTTDRRRAPSGTRAARSTRRPRPR